MSFNNRLCSCVLQEKTGFAGLVDLFPPLISKNHNLYLPNLFQSVQVTTMPSPFCLALSFPEWMVDYTEAVFHEYSNCQEILVQVI